MAYIERPPRKPKPHGTGNREDVRTAYNRYKKNRLIYLARQPLCELCLDPKIVNENGKVGTCVTRATQVHHKHPISKGKNLQECVSLAKDLENMMSLCDFHHEYVHGRVLDPRFI